MLKQRVKRFLLFLQGREMYPGRDVRCDTDKLGSDYGGWEVVSALLSQNSVVYSFGVGKDVSFDLALIERYGLTIHAFDPTPGSIRWVKSQNLPRSFILHEYGLADFDGEVKFNPPQDPDFISHTLLDRPETAGAAIEVPVKKLSSIMKELDHRQINLLKMDIEGAEYQVIAALESSGIRPVQVLVEFHHRFPNVGLSETKEALSRLRKMGYGLFWVSGSGEEYGFILQDICP